PSMPSRRLDGWRCMVEHARPSWLHGRNMELAMARHLASQSCGRWLFLLAIVACQPAAAQTAVVQASPADRSLLQDLGDAERSIDAIRKLVRQGEPAVALLSAAIRDPVFREDQERMANAVYTLGKLGAAAVPAVHALIAE